MKLLFYIICLGLAGPLMAQSNGEPFEDFFYSFREGPEFQKNRIVFPLPSITIRMESERADTVKVQKSAWKYNDFKLMRSGVQMRVFDSFKRELRDTDERVVSLIGNDNGLYYSYFFKRIDGQWHLVMILDEST